MVDPVPAAAQAPVCYPLPLAEDDVRFTFGLTCEVADVLAAHGYPTIRSGADHVRLQQCLFQFLYRTESAIGGAA